MVTRIRESLKQLHRGLIDIEHLVSVVIESMEPAAAAGESVHSSPRQQRTGVDGVRGILQRLQSRLGDEIHRGMASIVGILVAAALAITAVIFVGVAIILANWESHPAVAAALVAAGLAVLAMLALLLGRVSGR